MQGIPEAPTFYPSEEEFADPLTYINKIRVEGEKYAPPNSSHPDWNRGLRVHVYSGRGNLSSSVI